MYLDDLPDAAVAQKIKATARGRAITTENGKAAGVAFTGDGKLVPESWIVRFDIAEGQDGRKLLADAFVATGATLIWYFGGDATTRQAVNDLGMESQPHTALFVRRAEPVGKAEQLNLRAASEMDARTRQLISRHVEHYDAPRFAAARARRWSGWSASRTRRSCRSTRSRSRWPTSAGARRRCRAERPALFSARAAA